MPRKKDGTPRLDSYAMRVVAAVHEQLAQELLWLARRSADAIQGRKANDDLAGLSDSFRTVVRARWRAEDGSTNLSASEPAGARELDLAIDSLVDLARLQMDRAASWRLESNRYGMGRPPKTGAAFELLAQLQDGPRRSTARGRRLLIQKSTAEVHALVAVEQAKDPSKSKRQIVENVARQGLAAAGMHATGDRVAQYTKNLLKRLAPSNIRK